MKTFRCACGERVSFDDDQCLFCGRELGFYSEAGTLVGLGPAVNGTYSTPYGPCRKCENYATRGVCNWLVPLESDDRLCRACRLIHVVPDASNATHRALLGEIEEAKRRLMYSLDRLRLPVFSRRQAPENGPAIDIAVCTDIEHALAGHTLLGHLCHELGHYFWERLVAGEDRLELFRERFGDERRDRAGCLAAYRAAPSDAAWSAEFITANASCHPLEDWAETFAYYLSMVDTLETAREFGFAVAQSPAQSLPGSTDFDLTVAAWEEFTLALNAVSRSMGSPAPYPFLLTPAVREKLELVHRIVREARSEVVRRESTPPPCGDEPLAEESSATRIAV